MTGPELLRSRGWRSKDMNLLRGTKGVVDQLWEHNSQWNVLHTFDSAIVDEALRLKAELDAACALIRGLTK